MNKRIGLALLAFALLVPGARAADDDQAKEEKAVRETRAWLTNAVGRRIHVDGELRDRDDVLAEARCAFLHVPLEHFLQTAEGRAAAEAWRSRLGS